MKQIFIGVGNQYRHDDAAGIEVARRLRATGLPGATVFELDGEPVGLLDAWDGADLAYVVDALRGNSPGRVHRLEVGPSEDARLTESQARDSSHALGLGDAVELGRVLGRLPRRLILLGIEGSDFNAGEGLSNEVEGAVMAIVAELSSEATEWPGSGNSSGPEESQQEHGAARKWRTLSRQPPAGPPR